MSNRAERIGLRDKQRDLLTKIEEALGDGMTESVGRAENVRDRIVYYAKQIPGVVERYQAHRVKE